MNDHNEFTTVMAEIKSYLIDKCQLRKRHHDLRLHFSFQDGEVLVHDLEDFQKSAVIAKLTEVDEFGVEFDTNYLDDSTEAAYFIYETVCDTFSYGESENMEEDGLAIAAVLNRCLDSKGQYKM